MLAAIMVPVAPLYAMEIAVSSPLILPVEEPFVEPFDGAIGYHYTMYDLIIDRFDFAFQPIVHTATGHCLGVEALLRGTEQEGYPSILDFFDAIARDRVLFGIDLKLRERAMRKFAAAGLAADMRLFYNVDNRVTAMPDYRPGQTGILLERHALPPNSFCFELSERYQFRSSEEMIDIVRQVKDRGLRIALDDFGAGFSGLQVLYQAEPDYMKIDRFFIDGIENDSKKRLFVSTVVSLSHTLGIEVIAEGIETEEAFHVCRDIGCDYVQGFLIQRPTLEIAEIRRRYDIVADMNRRNQRGRNRELGTVLSQMVELPPIVLPRDDMRVLLEYFRRNKDRDLAPVTDARGEPLGIILETDLKEFIYAPFGRDLLLNRNVQTQIQQFVRKRPVAEVSQRIEKMLELFNYNRESEGIVLTEGGRYRGFLSTRAILAIVTEKDIATARDQNPLTRLPGNRLITEHIAEMLDRPDRTAAFVYFDFDNFKPFNDTYGFRLGDRAILMFADILNGFRGGKELFVGHIGGDDFFASFTGARVDPKVCLDLAAAIVQKFGDDVKSLYSADDRERGFILAADREGVPRRFPLLTVSASVLFVEYHTEALLPERIDRLLTDLKKRAKSDPTHLAWITV